MHQLFRLHLGQFKAAQIGDGQFPEYEINERRAEFHCIRTLHHAIGLEAGEQEGIAEFFQRHPMLKAHRYGDRKAVEHGAEGRAFLVDIQEDFAKGAVFVFPGAQVELGATDGRGLGVAAASIR